MAKLFWFICHGFGWNFHKPIANLKVPCLLAGSKKDEYCSLLEDKYQELKDQNNSLQIHMFEEGNHPAILSNKKAFFDLIQDFLKIK
ncbi:MAG: alpha/beta fold hydrolase [Bacteroidales bacterium]